MTNADRLAAMAARLWKRGRATADPAHAPPTIGPGGAIVGLDDARVTPETVAERFVATESTIYRNLRTPAATGGPDRLAVTADGRIVGHDPYRLEPETDAERAFLNSWRPDGG